MTEDPRRLMLVYGGHPALKATSQEVGPEGLDEARLIAQRLRTLCVEHDGLGMAANQIGVTKRIAFIKPPGDTGYTIVNPVFTPAGNRRTSAREGCLSYPNFLTRVMRWEQGTLEYTTLEGKRKTRHISRLEARIVQHEIDHLDGITIMEK